MPQKIQKIVFIVSLTVVGMGSLLMGGTVTETYLDQFNARTYDGNDGSMDFGR